MYLVKTSEGKRFGFFVSLDKAKQSCIIFKEHTIIEMSDGKVLRYDRKSKKFKGVKK